VSPIQKNVGGEWESVEKTPMKGRYENKKDDYPTKHKGGKEKGGE